MYDEEDWQPISALQHLAFCPRQWGLIHLEGQWADNRLTAEGNLLHRRADVPADENRPGLRVAHRLHLHSRRLGLVGLADVVEFHRLAAGDPAGAGAALPGAPGRWRPFPVEYKRGAPKTGPWDLVQLCAQALCLEEMLGAAVPAGAIFYGRPRRRTAVSFDPGLRGQTEELAARLHELARRGRTPPPSPGPHCKNCSLRETCLPQAAAGPSASAYLRRELARALAGEDAS
ncbi:MAG: CRISPR-associated protein Cas4 [Thermodesulfobacteriota bacterium]